MSITSMVRPVFWTRRKALERYGHEAEALQRGVMKRLVQKAEHTEWGKSHGFAKVKTYEDFAA